jgi:hypothetical protein
VIVVESLPPELVAVTV